MLRSFLARLPIALLAAVLGLMAAPARSGDLTVFAAASLKDALEEIADAFAAQTGARPRLSLAGSSAIARQIAQGAPADLVITADAAWMDRLAADGLIVPESRRDLVGNRLVLIASAPVPPVEIWPALDLPGLLGEGRLAMALTEAVPAGIYGKAALTALGLWEGVAPRIAEAENVRAALRLVAAGEAPLGLVYATDARAEPRVRILATFPETSHPPIVYPAARVARSENALAAPFLAFLGGPEATAAFARQGFQPLGD
ncbi:MAG: molybdate ABC transporter substrate-binding protein [Paracoccaceae bacterium]